MTAMSSWVPMRSTLFLRCIPAAFAYACKNVWPILPESINKKMNTYAKKMHALTNAFLLLGFHEKPVSEYICNEAAVTVEALRARLIELGIPVPPEDLLALLAPAQDLRRRADELGKGGQP